MTTNNQVPGGPNQPGVANATPKAGSSVANSATPTPTPADAELQRKLQEALAAQKKLSDDLNKMKSVYQRKESDLQREARQRELEWKQELQKIQMSSMDDEARKNYENELAREQLQSAMQELESLRQDKQAMEAKQLAFDWFRQSGVPIDQLELSGTLEELTQSGYSYLAGAAQRLRELEASQQAQPPQSPNQPQQPVGPAPLPTAPNPDLGATGVASIGPTWAEVDEQWKDKGGREAFYLALQNGQLSPEALPINKDLDKTE